MSKPNLDRFHGAEPDDFEKHPMSFMEFIRQGLKDRQCYRKVLERVLLESIDEEKGDIEHFLQHHIELLETEEIWQDYKEAIS